MDAKEADSIAEMYMSGSWKLRLKIIKKLIKEKRPTKSQLLEMLIIGCFASTMKIILGKEEFSDYLNAKKLDEEV